MRYKLQEVADFFLAKEEMSGKKLEKLLYFTQAWSSTLLDHPLLDLDFTVAHDGPTNDKIKRLYQGILPKQPMPDINNEKVLKLLESVWTTYGFKDEYELIALTNRQKVVKNALAINSIITTKAMHDYYIKQFNGNF